MTDPISLTITLPPAQALAAGQEMASRQLGPMGRLSVMMLAPLGGGMITVLGLAWMMGERLETAALFCLYAYFGIMAGLIIAQRIWGRRYGRIYASSQMRKLPAPITMDDSGITFHPRHLPWATVSKTARWKDCTLVHFSSVDALAIPDTDLPMGETPESFAARIAKWKAR